MVAVGALLQDGIEGRYLVTAVHSLRCARSIQGRSHPRAVKAEGSTPQRASTSGLFALRRVGLRVVGRLIWCVGEVGGSLPPVSIAHGLSKVRVLQGLVPSRITLSMTSSGSSVCLFTHRSEGARG